MEYLCSCGAEASFYAELEQKHLCLYHKKHFKAKGQVYFNKQVLKNKVLNEMIGELKELSSECEKTLDGLQIMVENIYRQVNEAFERESSKLLSSLAKIEEIVETLQNPQPFVQALNIFTLVQDNPAFLLSGLKDRVSLKINPRFSKTLESLIQVHSNLEDLLYTPTPIPAAPLSFQSASKIRYDLLKVAKNYHPPANHGQLTLWIESLDVPRNLLQFKTLSISGTDVNEEVIDGYSLLPSVYHVRDLCLISFEKDSFDSIVSKLLSQCRKITRLQLEDCDVSKQSSEFIMNSISECEEFTELIISQCGAGDILAIIPSKVDLKYLTTLSFSKAFLADEGIEVISKLFPKMHSLCHLHLDNNAFTNQGAVSLILHLSFLQELRDINLSNNKIGECLGFIFQSLSYIPLLGKINVSSTMMHESQHDLVLGCVNRFSYLESILFDMTLPQAFLQKVKSLVPGFCHVFKDNPELEMSFEVN